MSALDHSSNDDHKIIKTTDDSQYYCEKFANDLNTQRLVAKNEGKPGPIVMVIGPTGTGKSQLTRILANNSLNNWSPLLIDLDVGQGAITLPGLIGAGVLQDPFQLEDFFWKLQGTMIHHYGHQALQKDPLLFQSTMKSLAQDVQRYFFNDNNVDRKSSGVIINSHGWIDGSGFDSIKMAIEIFNVNIVCTLADQKLFHCIKSLFPDIIVLFFDRINVTRKKSVSFRRKLRLERIELYFRNYTDSSLVSVSNKISCHTLYEIYSVEKFNPLPGSGRPYQLRIGPETKKFVVSRLPPETLVTLVNNVVSILEMSFEDIVKADATDGIGTLRVQALGRIVGINAENGTLSLMIPKRFEESLMQGCLILVANI